MNQNINQKQKEQMSQEELQRTQVINLKDVEEVVRFEKLTSKKPAIIVAVIGLICLTFGSSFAFVQSMSARKAKDTPKIQNRKRNTIEPKTNIKTLDCTKQITNEPEDATNKTINYNLIFKDEKLTKFTKTFSMIPKTAESEESKKTVSDFKTALQPYLIEIDGYKVTVIPENTGGIITSTEVDYNSIDITKVPSIHQINYRFNVTYEAYTTKETIEKDLTTQGYKCK